MTHNKDKTERKTITVNDEKIIKDLNQELRRGTIILSVLLSLNEMDYGYGLLNKLNESGLDITPQTLYPLLNRLQEKNLLDIQWITKEETPRKFYQTNENGRKACAEMIEQWEHLNSCVENLRRNI